MRLDFNPEQDARSRDRPGRAESAEAADKGGTGYDVYGLVFVHSMLVVPLACVALFTLAATCWLLLKGLLHASADALAYAAHQAAALAAAEAAKLRQRRHLRRDGGEVAR